MNYVSTRGQAPVVDFEQALMAGLARDGGLYVPAAWPALSAADIAGLAGRPYAEAAVAVMRSLIGDVLPADELARLTAAAYAPFAHDAVAPLVQVGDGLWVLELFHGPTLAFKDMAMQLLGPLIERGLARHGQRATIVGATSGDTGAAAIEAFKGREAIDIVILFPEGRVSDMQRRQMTTAAAGNVHTVAVRGTFDDCQAIVKALFNDLDFRDRTRLSAVNSINWARIAAQTVYYFTAAAALGAPHRAVSFAVPTGNFGDAFAGYAARCMGLPVARLVIGTNVNDILVRTFAGGRYQPRAVVATASPSMDIQVSSNFERLLFEIGGRDSLRVRALMAALGEEGGFDLSDDERAGLAAVFAAHRVDEAETARTIREVHARTGYLADPHTAVGIAAALKESRDPATPMVMLATAHPAKFPQTVAQAAECTPPVPDRLAAVLGAREHCTVVDNSVAAVKDLIAGRVRAAS